MADIYTKQKRSEVMARIRSRGNKTTEATLGMCLRAAGISGWRRHRTLRLKEGEVAGVSRALQVTPDFVFAAQRLAVFTDGCFWHGCPRHHTPPRSNARFWRQKITGNVQRDRLVRRLLKKNGWSVIRLWEHDIKRRPTACVRRIASVLERVS